MQNPRIDITLQQTSHYDNYHNANDLNTFFRIELSAVALISIQLCSRCIERTVQIIRPGKKNDIGGHKQQCLREQGRYHKQKPSDTIADDRHRQKASCRQTGIANIKTQNRHSDQSGGRKTQQTDGQKPMPDNISNQSLSHRSAVFQTVYHVRAQKTSVPDPRLMPQIDDQYPDKESDQKQIHHMITVSDKSLPAHSLTIALKFLIRQYMSTRDEA